MTPEFGAASQLEKIDMLDFADVVAINKLDRRGGEDTLRDVRRQMVRNTESFGSAPEDMPVFGTIASRFNDDGVTALYQELRSGSASTASRRGRARAGGREGIDHRRCHRAAGPGPLPGRGGRSRAGLPPLGRRAGRGRPSPPAARVGAGDAR